MLGTTVQNLVALATWRPGYVHCNIYICVCVCIYIYVCMYVYVCVYIYIYKIFCSVRICMYITEIVFYMFRELFGGAFRGISKFLKIFMRLATFRGTLNDVLRNHCLEALS